VATSLLEFLRPFSIIAIGAAVALSRGYRAPSEFYLVWAGAAVLSLLLSVPLLVLHYRALSPDQQDREPSTFRSVARRLVGFGSLAQASNVVQFLNYRSLFFALERHAGLAAVGLFSTAVSLAEVMWIPANSIAVIVLNRVSRSASEQGTRDFLMRMARLTFVAMGVSAVVASLVPVQGLTALLGRDFGGVRALLLQLMPGVVALGCALVASSYNAGRAFYMRNLVATLAGLCLTLAGFFWLIHASDPRVR
jgi:O-antigen/teichoic acid export membrane protein